MSQVSTSTTSFFVYFNCQKTNFINIKYLLLNIKNAETHLSELHGTRVHVQDNEDEIDRELFEPTHDCWDGDEDAMDTGHRLQIDENDNDDDGVIQRPPQGKASFHATCLFIVQMLNLFL